MNDTPPPTIVLLAGEESGDQLGADLLEALRKRFPAARFAGIGGRRMRALGFEAWHDVAELSLFGLAEVVAHLPRLLRLRRELVARLLRERPAVVVGIDAPDFNLGVERRVKQAGLRAVHYVSPSVWAWREGRVEKIGRAADRVLCLFPMEPPIYARHHIDARFTGHPLADRFPLVSDRAAARETLQLPPDAPVLAVLPGSRGSELARLGEPFFDAARRVAAALPGLRIVVPAANPTLLEHLRTRFADGWPAGAAPDWLDGRAHLAMQAADVVLLASGTATLEAMLAKRPMVVGYRVSPLSYHIARLLRLLRTDVYSLPNVLARACGMGEQAVLVPELMQRDCTGTKLAGALLALFNDSERRGAIVGAFEQLHQALRANLAGSAAEAAAEAIGELVEQPSARSPLGGSAEVRRGLP
ncbi:MAG: lipid-A-disaccharide synthase [Rhodanobacter sp.]|nr:MAG: lipid-A-disaccharide synthase [Rhodanobacter sp.]TAM13554.1 MAG: lipid-A-disaccharide synthase [Rhodanobacter sp.]TAM35693.1 MAG: lipid-A-disaccharide synthase [Rhodanobacter sp.]